MAPAATSWLEIPTDLNTVMAPSGADTPPSRSAIVASGIRPTLIKSPASAAAASRSSTTTKASSTSAPGSSAISGVKAPTAFTCTPGRREEAENSGSRAGVAHDTTSALATAASASNSTSPPTRAASDSACDRERLHTSTRSIGRTSLTAATWSKAIAPAPNMARVFADSEASSRVARPHPAPVRIAVNVEPSTIPSGEPSSPNTATTPTGFPGTIDTTLMPVVPPTRPGMNSDPPSNCRRGVSMSEPKAASIARTASPIGSAARSSSGPSQRIRRARSSLPR